MIGIISYAAYLPRYRLNRMNIFSAMGWLNPALIMNAAGEKAVAGYDEDAITMAAAAGKRWAQYTSEWVAPACTTWWKVVPST